MLRTARTDFVLALTFNFTGGHGAGMTNIVFAPPTATVIEFPLKPHVDRCYGFISMAFGLDYWVVPSVSAGYFSRYAMDEEKAQIIVRLVQHVIRTKDLSIVTTSRSKADEL